MSADAAKHDTEGHALEWRAVPLFDGYEVSSMGDVRRCADARTSSAGKVLVPWLERSTGYLRVTLRRDGKSVKVGVHRIVCWAFSGPPPTPDHQAAHDDGIKTRNTVGNLDWKTHAENAADRIRLGENAVGDSHPHTKIPDAAVREIRLGPRRFGDAREIASKYGVRRQSIYDIRARRKRVSAS